MMMRSGEITHFGYTRLSLSVLCHQLMVAWRKEGREQSLLSFPAALAMPQPLDQDADMGSLEQLTRCARGCLALH